MNWDDLRLLLAVGRSRSLSDAGRGLRVDQTTVSRRLSALEAELGARLVDREPSGSRLTDAGRAAVAAAAEMERNALSLQQIRGLDEGLSGCVRVTTLGTLVPIVAEAIAELRRTSPRLTFEVRYEARAVDLIRGEADVALRSGTMRDARQPSLVGRKLAAEEWSLFGASSYLRRRGPLTPGLRGHAIIAYGEPLSRVPGGVWLDEHAREADVALRINNPLSAAECAATGLGLAAVPVSIARSLGLVRVGPTFGTTGLWAMTTARVARIPRVRAFVDMLVKAFRARREEFRAGPLGLASKSGTSSGLG